MNSRLNVSIICAAVAIIAVQNRTCGDEPVAPLRDDQLTGTWSFLWTRVNGGPMVKGNARDKLTLTFRGNDIFVDYGDDGNDTWKFEIARSAGGGRAGRMLIYGPGKRQRKELYTFESGRLILCQTAMADKWPEEIDWGIGSGLEITTFGRVLEGSARTNRPGTTTTGAFPAEGVKRHRKSFFRTFWHLSKLRP